MGALAITQVTATGTMSTRVIAQVVNSRHADVMRTADRLIARGVIGGYVPMAYTHEQNGQQYKEYQINERDSYVVVAQLCPEFTAKLVDWWQSTRHQIYIPQNLPEALRLAADLAEKNTVLESQLAITAPKAQALDRIINTDGLFGIREAAKSLKIKQGQLTKFLLDHGWAFRTKKSNQLQAYAKRIEQGLLTHVLTNPMPDKEGIDQVYHHMKITAKGVAQIAGILEKEAAK